MHASDASDGMATRRVLVALGVVIAALLAAVVGDVIPSGPRGGGEVTASPDLVDLEEVALDDEPIGPAAPPPAPPVLPALPEAAEPVVEAAPAEAPTAQESASARRFAEEFPAHAAARQRAGDPASFHWAVIVGVNDYAAPTGDTFGSVPDAVVLREVLLDRGWHPDHILVLTDAEADHDRTVRALEWLARSTDERSTVVLSVSGHIRHRDGRTGLWPADNRYIWAEDFGRMVSAIASERMWVTLQGCHAGGLAAPGVEAPGRIVTYSSPVTQKSYEDPETEHSLQGYYVFAEGLRDGWGDADGDGRVSVQEAHAWGAPRAETRSAGLQVPVMVDGLGHPFHLEVGAP